MTPAPVTTSPDAPVADCGRAMLRLGIRHLLVVDAEGRFAGSLLDAGVFARGGFAGQHGELWLAFDEADFSLKARDLALAHPPIEAPGAPLSAALRRMDAAGADHLVAADAEGRPVGILTEHDVVRLCAVALDPRLDLSRVDRARSLVTVQVDDPAGLARARLDQEGVRHLVVLEGEALAGVLSARDLHSERVGPEDLRRVEEVLLRREVQVATPSTTLREAAEDMARHKVGCLPVLDSLGHPVGVITRRDLLEALVAGEEAEASFA